MFTAQQYVKASSLEEAFELNKKKSSAVLGGGCWLRLGKRSIGTIIDLSGLGLDKIEEKDDGFYIGAMVTLRQLETDARLKEVFGTGFEDMTRHIVGVQFRNCATLGGSLFSRFGFSDILTYLLALDCQVELVGAGTVSLEEFSKMPFDRDILKGIVIKKNGRKAVYESFRNTETDIPVLTCALSQLGDELRLVIGARPAKAAVIDGVNAENADSLIEKAKSLTFGDNLRASGEYRRHLAGVLTNRALKALQEVK